MLARDGKEVDRLIGAAPKPQLESWLEEPPRALVPAVQLPLVWNRAELEAPQSSDEATGAVERRVRGADSQPAVRTLRPWHRRLAGPPRSQGTAHAVDVSSIVGVFRRREFHRTSIGKTQGGWVKPGAGGPQLQAPLTSRRHRPTKRANGRRAQRSDRSTHRVVERRVLARLRSRGSDALAGRVVWCTAALPGGHTAGRRLRELLHGDLEIVPLAVGAAEPPAELARQLEAMLAGIPSARSLGAAERAEYARGAELAEPALGGRVRPRGTSSCSTTASRFPSQQSCGTAEPTRSGICAGDPGRPRPASGKRSTSSAEAAEPSTLW